MKPRRIAGRRSFGHMPPRIGTSARATDASRGRLGSLGFRGQAGIRVQHRLARHQTGRGIRKAQCRYAPHEVPSVRADKTQCHGGLRVNPAILAGTPLPGRLERPAALLCSRSAFTASWFPVWRGKRTWRHAVQPLQSGIDRQWPVTVHRGQARRLEPLDAGVNFRSRHAECQRQFGVGAGSWPHRADFRATKRSCGLRAIWWLTIRFMSSVRYSQAANTCGISARFNVAACWLACNGRPAANRALGLPASTMPKECAPMRS